MRENNETMIQMFEWYLPEDGTFWKTVVEQSEQLKELGITKVWLPPAYKGAQGIHDVGYGVYDMYDLGEFDQKGTIPTKYGTKDMYLKAVQALHKQGMEVLADVVFNHRMGADEKETVLAVEDSIENRNLAISGEKEVEVWTKFTFPNRKGKYSDFTWNVSHFDGTDWDEREKRSGVYLFHGKQWDQNVDGEHGNYDYLMGADLDIDNEEVREELLRWGKWYFETTKVDGVRLDAVKHIGAPFYGEWLEQMRSLQKTDFFAVGEYWSADLGALQYYLEKSGHSMRLFDVPLHFHFCRCAGSNGSFDMRTMWKDTLTGTDASHSVAFVDNHDTQPGQALCSFVMEWFKPLAYGMILLRKDTIPCVFYGDLYGIAHDGLSPVKGLEQMLRIRKNNLYGEQHDYMDDAHCIGWTFEGEEKETAVAVILTNECAAEKRMYVGTQHAGEIYRDLLKNRPDEIEIDESGYGNFRVEGGSISVYCTFAH